MTNQRLDPYKAAPGIYPAIKGMQERVVRSSLPSRLIHLVYLRVSQVNQCAFCINMHVDEARAEGESEDRLHLLQVWREVPLFTPRERAAFAWAEAVTLVAQTQVPDEVFAEARSQFTEAELAELTLAVVTINSWNRFAISFRIPPKLAREAVSK